MTEADISSLVENYKIANKSLRKRSVTIGVLAMLTIGLVYMESVRLSTVIDLLNYQGNLEKISELNDTVFIKVVDGEDEAYFPAVIECNSCLERLTLYKRIKRNNYDKKLVIDAITNIEGRIDKINEEKAIDVLGFSIPITPMYYVFFLIMLVLFHDFTQTIIYRNKAYKRIKGLAVPNWKLGFELFGFYSTSNNASLKFVRFTSSIISSIFILCPFLTSLMMLDLSKSHTIYEDILMLLNIFCFVLIIIDTLIIFYWENTWNFKYISNLLLGKYRISKSEMRILWIGLSTILVVVLLVATFEYDSSIGFKLAFFTFGCAQIAGLYFAVMRCFNKPSKLRRGIRALLLIINLCWFFFIMFRTNNVGRFYAIRDFEYVFLAWCMFFITSLIIAFIYSRWFLTDRYKITKHVNTLDPDSL